MSVGVTVRGLGQEGDTALCARCFQRFKHLLTKRVPQLSHRKCLQSTELLEFYTPKIRGF